ncbi:family 2 glycosyl transferase [Halovivax asiaticus JCM 14624]|uniref:Family 2 glycosyl transferase n=1 Tax=Halovivax asiaticus JCM 14624 TaxID=1227490 RepID=M0BKY3_9EURY|nr:glycosyltransferase family 2 protein [Halovivax asiaticus]ELZ10968.1 family 2 glycosyl transferase [Halovivax asiaticus JCM 14624]
MYRDARVGVVVPAYNESALVATVVETMPAFVDRIYVVDDCSTDDTWDHVRRAVEQASRSPDESDEGSRESADAASASRRSDGESDQPASKFDRTSREPGHLTSDEETDRSVDDLLRSAEHADRPVGEATKTDGGIDVGERAVAIRHAENQGVGGAVTTGYERALSDDVDVVAVMNGDAQMDPDELPRLLDPIVEDEADYAKGNRLLESEFREGMTRWRLFGNWSLTLLTKIASGYWKTMDPQNGYTAITREALETLGPSDLYQDYGFCNDVLVQLNANDYTVADVPMAAVYGDETSSIEYSSFIPRLSGLLLDRFFWRLRVKYLVRDFHPLALFYCFGICTVVAGAIGGIAAVASDGDRRGTITGVAGVVLIPIGGLALLIAMTLDMRANRDREVCAE